MIRSFAKLAGLSHSVKMNYSHSIPSNILLLQYYGQVVKSVPSLPAASVWRSVTLQSQMIVREDANAALMVVAISAWSQVTSYR